MTNINKKIKLNCESDKNIGLDQPNNSKNDFI